MIASLVATIIIIAAGLLLFWLLYDAMENETNKMLVLVGYLLSAVILIIHWFSEYIGQILAM